MKMRNIAIIAHVDHGKTTLVDAMLKQSGTFRENQVVQERIMDSGDLERERGITISAKATSVEWHGARINIVDTPGHADFGGEVERILNMVDGAVVLVDAAEGPLPQTKFVLSKALKLGLKPIVVINKVDRPDARIDEVLNEMFDLFVMLDATDEQLDFPVLYACGRDGWAVNDLSEEHKDLTDLFNVILTHVPAPICVPDAPFSMLVTTLEMDPFVGRVLTGKIHSGQIKVNSTIKAIDMNGKLIETARVSKIMAFRGVQRTGIDFAYAGDIVQISGFKQATVADTLCDPVITVPIKATPIDPPTLAMTFSVNDSPYAGKDGTKVTSRVIGERLFKEAEGNVALKVKNTDQADAFEVAGRGELQLGILIETMRREGFELSISRPRVLFKEDENGKRLEPYEDVVIDVDDAYTGNVAEKMGIRKGQMIDMRSIGGGKTRMTFKAPSRGLIGYHSEFLTDTSGTGIMNRLFSHYGEYLGEITGRRNGVLISMETGAAVPYALDKIQERGALFITGGDMVYGGMIIGENAKSGDIEVNPIKAKQLTNFRAAGKDEAVVLTPPRQMSLEQAISYIENDELVEVTPHHIRLRKKLLDPHERKRAMRAAEEA